MKKHKATGLIKITKLPSGDLDLDIRKAWVGETLPCHPILGFSATREFSAVGKKPVQKRYCFSVPQDLAIEVLEKSKPKIAAKLRHYGLPVKGKCFAFDESEAEIISGVTRQKIIRGYVPGDPLGP